MKDLLDDMPDDELRDKLSGYRETPDDAVWDGIRKDVRTTLSGRLRSYEEAPDEVVWTSIAARLRPTRIPAMMELAAALVVVLSAGIIVYSPFTKVSEQLAATSAKIPATIGENRDGENSREEDVVEILKEEEDTNVRQNAEGKRDVSVTGFEIVNRDAAIVPPSYKATAGTMPATDDITIQNSNLTATAMDSTKADTLIGVVDVVKVEADTLPKPAAAEKKKPGRRTSRLYAIAMPTLGYHHIEPLADDDILIQSVDKIRAFSPRRLGVRAEVGWERSLAENLAVHAGLFYLHRVQEIRYTYYDSENFEVTSPDHDSLVYDITPVEQSSTFTYELRNIGAVAGASYELRSGRLRHRFGAGVEFHYSLSKSGRERPDDASVYMFGNVYYRIAYPVAKRIDVVFQPTINYAMHVDDRLAAPFYVKAYGLGLNFGATYNLRLKGQQ